jgi:MOSC domain-containing protein YiiM
MIDDDLPDLAGAPLVRGLAACLSSVTELPLVELPRPADDAPVTHALAGWKTWLAGRDFGMVPIAEPRSFQWAGYWIAVVDAPQGQAAVVAFGTPPGVVLSPQDPALLGRATAELPISSAYAVASLNPVVPPVQEAAALAGTVDRIAVAPRAEAPMQLVESARALAGRGLEGDRYADGAGTFSPRGADRPGYELTLFAAEVLDDLADEGFPTDFASTRRNVLTRGVDVNALVGREFRIGDVRCRGLRLAEPCVHLDRVSGTPRLRPLIHRGGLRADILTGGALRAGLPITTTD